MISAILPPDDTIAHTRLSLTDVDELHSLNRRILLRSAVICFVLDGQERQEPGDDADRPMNTQLREALQEFSADIRIAAGGIAAVIERATKGGA